MKTKHIVKTVGLITAIFISFTSCDDNDSVSVPSIDQDITGITETEQRTFYLRSDNVEVVVGGTITSIDEDGGTFVNNGRTSHDITANLGDGEGAIVFQEPETSTAPRFFDGTINADGTFSYKIDRSLPAGTSGFVEGQSIEDFATVTGRFGFRESDLKIVGVGTERRVQRIKDGDGETLATYTITSDLLLIVESGISFTEPPSTSSIIYGWINETVRELTGNNERNPIFQIRRRNPISGIRG